MNCNNRLFSLLFLSIFSAFLLSGCYSFKATSLPKHIQTIYIAEIKNLTNEAILARNIEEALKRTLQKNASTIQIINDPNSADAEINLTLTSYTNAAYNYTAQANVETYKSSLVVQFSFFDNKEKKMIYENRSLKAEGVYDLILNETEEEDGQRRAIESLQELIINNALSQW